MTPSSTGEQAKGKTPRRFRVLLADDSEAVIREIELLLADDFEIVGKAANGQALVEEAARLRPDLIVTDLEMPGMNGLEASREALRINPGQPILLLTAHPDPRLAHEALEAGISGYVLKFSAAEELIPAAQGALRGETFISPGVDLPVY
jgi:DNA-binding NarL/FixJ family response regulator